MCSLFETGNLATGGIPFPDLRRDIRKIRSRRTGGGQVALAAGREVGDGGVERCVAAGRLSASLLHGAFRLAIGELWAQPRSGRTLVNQLLIGATKLVLLGVAAMPRSPAMPRHVPAGPVRVVATAFWHDALRLTRAVNTMRRQQQQRCSPAQALRRGPDDGGSGNDSSGKDHSVRLVGVVVGGNYSRSGKGGRALYCGDQGLGGAVPRVASCVFCYKHMPAASNALSTPPRR
jgi:hypothetical protein